MFAFDYLNLSDTVEHNLVGPAGLRVEVLVVGVVAVHLLDVVVIFIFVVQRDRLGSPGRRGFLSQNIRSLSLPHRHLPLQEHLLSTLRDLTLEPEKMKTKINFKSIKKDQVKNCLTGELEPVAGRLSACWPGCRGRWG